MSTQRSRHQKAINLDWPADRIASFRAHLLAWFHMHKRDFPWRRSREPYHVFLAEMMLQQTQSERVVLYFSRFLKRFPDIEALAQANLDDVLREWQGLGFYRRARHLHESARAIVSRYQSKIPSTIQELMKLPGIGPYTARAIASIAFNVPCAVVDGNVVRVLARLFCSPETLRTSYQHLADTLLDKDNPGDFNQALMEHGSTICLPKTPKCTVCPIQAFCCANKRKAIHDFPSRISQKPKPRLPYWVFLLRWGNEWIIARKKKGLLADMWLFPMLNKEAYPELTAYLTEVPDVHHSGHVTHVFSHRVWEMDILYGAWHDRPVRPSIPGLFRMNEDYSIVQWLPMEKIRRLPMPSAHQKVLTAFLANHPSLKHTNH